jgi:hypothetical protein
MMILQFLLVHIHDGTFIENCVLANELLNFFRVDIISPTVDECSL